MHVCVIGNFSDTRCGISNFCHQTVTALNRAGHDAEAFDGTYPQVYKRREASIDPFFPANLADFEVLHVIWHAITLNHYAGVKWALMDQQFPHLLRSFWDCGPSDAYCPFDQWFPVKWMLYKDHREGYHLLDYPVPDWVIDLPQPDPGFVVGASSVRGDGVAALRQVCELEGWTMNLPTGGWLTIEDEIRRLARSTVNVCWYNSGAGYKDRASAPSMLIASTRPVLVNDDDHLLAHIVGRPDIYHGLFKGSATTAGTDEKRFSLHAMLQQIHQDWQDRVLLRPEASYQQMQWKTAAQRMTDVWANARQGAKV